MKPSSKICKKNKRNFFNIFFSLIKYSRFEILIFKFIKLFDILDKFEKNKFIFFKKINLFENLGVLIKKFTTLCRFVKKGVIGMKKKLVISKLKNLRIKLFRCAYIKSLKE